MKTATKKESQEQKENLKNTRKTLKLLQQTASDKENLTGRPHIDKDTKLSDSKHETKRKKVEDKAVQTGECVITAEDLTSDEPSIDYWKSLAEKRQEMLDDSLHEQDRLREHVDALQEENRICKEMLDESRHLVEVLQEMLTEGDTEVAEEATEES